MIVAALVFVSVLVFVVRAVSRRRRVLAGLVATRPQFVIEPPTRRMSDRRRESL